MIQLLESSALEFNRIHALFGLKLTAHFPPHKLETYTTHTQIQTYVWTMPSLI